MASDLQRIAGVGVRGWRHAWTLACSTHGQIRVQKRHSHGYSSSGAGGLGISQLLTEITAGACRTVMCCSNHEVNACYLDKCGWLLWRTEPGLIPDVHHGSYATEPKAHKSNMHVPLASSWCTSLPSPRQSLMHQNVWHHFASNI
jgi:hypothetical protein